MLIALNGLGEEGYVTPSRLPAVEQQKQSGNKSKQSENDVHALKAQAEERLQNDQDQIDRQ